MGVDQTGAGLGHVVPVYIEILNSRVIGCYPIDKQERGPKGILHGIRGKIFHGYVVGPGEDRNPGVPVKGQYIGKEDRIPYLYPPFRDKGLGIVGGYFFDDIRAERAEDLS